MSRVLVVDDDQHILDVMAEMLGDLDVDLAPNGEAALDAAIETHPDIVLLDVMMPGIDGLEVCRRLKRMENPPKVVMVSAKTARKDQDAGQAAGCDEYLCKPFSPLEVLRLVESAA